MYTGKAKLEESQCAYYEGKKQQAKTVRNSLRVQTRRDETSQEGRKDNVKSRNRHYDNTTLKNCVCITYELPPI